MHDNTTKQRIIQELVPGKQITIAHVIANPDKILYRKLGLDPAVDYSKDAFLHNPVASVTDTTGYVQRVPFDEVEADSYEDMFDVPVSYEKFENKE